MFQQLSTTTTWALLCLLMLPTLFSNSDKPFLLQDEISPAQKHKAAVAQRVYNDIAQTARDYRQPPIFNFLYQEKDGDLYYNAYYNPKNNGIYMSEPLYDLAASFGSDSLNVLALILGHELAHFYKGHGWGMAFGMANEDIKIAQKIYQKQYDSQQRAEMEAEADYFGGLFGYLAGYNTLKVGAKFFKKLYVAAELPDSVKGYPTLNERVKICENSQQKLMAQLPAFKAANWITVMGEYPTASACFDYLITVLPSRELYNNAGISSAMQALSFYSAKELRYAYPFGLETDTYLDTSYMATRSGKDKKEEATSGEVMDKTDPRPALLIRATERFEAAIKSDNSFAPAYTHLSLTQSLQGSYEQAVAQAGKAVELSKTTPHWLSNAQIARGIAYAHLGQASEAKKLWEAALAGNAVYAQANLDVLKDKQFEKSLKQTKAMPIVFDAEQELIGEESLASLASGYDMREDFERVDMPSIHAEIPSVRVFSHNDDLFNMLIVEAQNMQDFTYDAWGLLLTNPDYKGKTARGIAKGSSLQELEAQYGQAKHKVVGGLGLLLHYESVNNPDVGLVFELDKQQKVANWGLYQHWKKG